MLRKSLLGAVTLGIVLLLAGPASAKGITSARFTGPGLPKGGITITGDHGPLESLGVLTDPMDKSDKPFTGATGPAYRVVVLFDFAPGEPIRQTLYPYAAGGPRTYTAVNQPLSGSFAPYGWYQATPDLLPFLRKIGFPAHAPLVTTGAIGAPGAGSSSAAWPAWAWVLIAAGMGGAVLLVAARQRRRVLA